MTEFLLSLLLQKVFCFLNKTQHYSLRSYAVSATNVGAVQSEIKKLVDQVKVGKNDSVLVDDLVKRLASVELENKTLRSYLQQLEDRLTKLDGQTAAKAAPAPAAKPATKKDDDFDLFDDDEDDEEAERIKQERLKAYADKKAKSISIHFLIWSIK